MISHSPNWVSTTYGDGIIIVEWAVVPPIDAAPELWSRFRLDLGEDEGRVANISGDLT